MPKRSRKKKRPDINELAKTVVDEATSEENDSTVNEKPEEETDQANNGKNPAAVELGRLGGLKGGKARWKGTTKKERREAARKAAQTRWAKHKQTDSE